MVDHFFGIIKNLYDSFSAIMESYLSLDLNIFPYWARTNPVSVYYSTVTIASQRLVQYLPISEDAT